MSCVLHYFQMSEAVSPIVRAFSPAFCHLSPILGPQGHVKIESDSQTSMLNRLIGQSCHGPDQSSLTPVPVRGSLCLNIQPDCVHLKKKEKEKGGNKIQTGRKCEFSPTSSQKWSLLSLTNINVRDPSSDQHVQLTRKKVLLKKIWRKSKNKEQEFSEGCFPPRINEARWFYFSLRLNENVCITCFAPDLMSRWHCQMKDFFFFFHSIETFPANLYFVSYAVWREAPSEAISPPSATQMIINHVIITFTPGPSLKRREDGVFLSGGRITYDPFMSRWEPLKIIIHHSSKRTNGWKGTECYKSDGICIFCLDPSKEQACREESRTNTLRSLVPREGGRLPPQVAPWLKTWEYQGRSFSRRRNRFSVILWNIESGGC